MHIFSDIPLQVQQKVVNTECLPLSYIGYTNRLCGRPVTRSIFQHLGTRLVPLVNNIKPKLVFYWKITILVFLAFFARIWALNSNMFICFAISFVGIFSAIVTPVSAFCKGKKRDNYGNVSNHVHCSLHKFGCHYL